MPVLNLACLFIIIAFINPASEIPDKLIFEMLPQVFFNRQNAVFWLISGMLFKIIVHWKCTCLLQVFTIDGGWAL